MKYKIVVHIDKIEEYIHTYMRNSHLNHLIQKEWSRYNLISVFLLMKEQSSPSLWRKQIAKDVCFIQARKMFYCSVLGSSISWFGNPWVSIFHNVSCILNNIYSSEIKNTFSGCLKMNPHCTQSIFQTLTSMTLKGFELMAWKSWKVSIAWLKQ